MSTEMSTPPPPSPAEAPITYLLVRTDLSLAQQMVQACHAGMGAAARFGEPEHNHLALLAVRDETELGDWAERLRDTGIAFHAFYEPDDATGWTALATQPLTRGQGRALRRLPLWRPGSATR